MLKLFKTCLPHHIWVSPNSVWLDTVAYKLYLLFGIRCIMFLLAAIRSITWATTSLHLWPAARTSSHSSDDQTQLSAKSAARPIIASVLGKYASWLNLKCQGQNTSWMCVGKFVWEVNRWTSSLQSLRESENNPQCHMPPPPLLSAMCLIIGDGSRPFRSNDPICGSTRVHHLFKHSDLKSS